MLMCDPQLIYTCLNMIRWRTCTVGDGGRGEEMNVFAGTAAVWRREEGVEEDLQGDDGMGGDGGSNCHQKKKCL